VSEGNGHLNIKVIIYITKYKKIKIIIFSIPLFFFILVCSFIVLSGSDRYHEKRHRKYAEETKCLAELRITSLRIYISDELAKTNSIENICKILKNDGHLSFFDSYGHENIFFNTNIFLWVDYSKKANTESSKDKDMRRLAVALRMKSDKYLGIRFDGTWCKTNAISTELHNVLVE